MEIPDELTKPGRSEPDRQSSSDSPKRNSKFSDGHYQAWTVYR